VSKHPDLRSLDVPIENLLKFSMVSFVSVKFEMLALFEKIERMLLFHNQHQSYCNVTPLRVCANNIKARIKFTAVVVVTTPVVNHHFSVITQESTIEQQLVFLLPNLLLKYTKQKHITISIMFHISNSILSISKFHLIYFCVSVCVFVKTNIIGFNEHNNPWFLNLPFPRSSLR